MDLKAPLDAGPPLANYHPAVVLTQGAQQAAREGLASICRRALYISQRLALQNSRLHNYARDLLQ